MKNNIFLLVAISLVVSSCLNFEKKKEKEPEPAETIGDQIGDQVAQGVNEGLAGLQDALSEVEKSLKEVNNGKEVEVVDFRDLKNLLPERISGMKRTASEGEKSGWGGFKVSKAEAKYEDGPRRMQISIVDSGGLMGLAQIGLAAWANAEVDRETEHGYERTTTIDGYQAYEKYDSKREEGQVSIIVANRFIVNVEGDQVPEKDMKEALRKLDLDKLKALNK